mgnify:CR=1 FL=1
MSVEAPVLDRLPSTACAALAAMEKGGITASALVDAVLARIAAQDSEGARAGDDDADVTLTASAETFRGMMEGNVNPTMAFMSGQLKIDGDMSLAMKLAAVLS